MAELENASPYEAVKWLLVPNISPNLGDESEGNPVGFASQLCLLVDALNMTFEAQFMEDFVSVENSISENLKSMVIPPMTVLDRVLKELFHEGGQIPNFHNADHKSSQMIKGAPLESLFAQFCLHTIWFGNCNIRAIATLWIEFVREVRWCWEESQPLPRMAANGMIDLSTCLVNQKLQMLAICIEKMHKLDQDSTKSIESTDIGNIEDDGLVRKKSFHTQTHAEGFNGIVDSPVSPDVLGSSKESLSRLSPKRDDVVVSVNPKFSDRIRTGSAGVVGSMMLLNSFQNMHAPFTQDAPLMTEDMHEERLQAVEAFGDSVNFSGQLERDILSSDMSAFKAANPEAVFEDFIRWHSPGDWEDAVKNSEDCKDMWPPRGRLSQRMSDPVNLWQKIWNDVPAFSVFEQKPLLDPNREGEKVLHYLETLRPHQLLEQMICTAFGASIDKLNQTNFGGFKQMKNKMGHLYSTITSVLKPLQANRVSANSEIFDDMKWLCINFEHVQKLLILAASLHRKFLHASRLSEAIFDDYYNFYLSKMGSGTVEGSADVEGFYSKQKVKNNERRVVENMFTPPTANQSWRKVISMGNLLNGHEPVLREIVFSTRDSVNNSHYAASDQSHHTQLIETYRMYISGTSNDLRVALSVTSGD